MLLVNLKERVKPEPKRISLPVQLSLFGILLAGLVLPRHPQVASVAPAKEPRALFVEEQEVVYSVLDRVQGDALVTESLNAVVDPTAKLLVGEHDHSLVFSSRFFEADGMAQETSILKILGRLNPGVPPTGEIAILDK